MICGLDTYNYDGKLIEIAMQHAALYDFENGNYYTQCNIFPKGYRIQKIMYTRIARNNVNNVHKMYFIKIFVLLILLLLLIFANNCIYESLVKLCSIFLETPSSLYFMRVTRRAIFRGR